jgi:hypothetical protein
LLQKSKFPGENMEQNTARDVYGNKVMENMERNTARDVYGNKVVVKQKTYFPPGF